MEQKQYITLLHTLQAVITKVLYKNRTLTAGDTGIVLKTAAGGIGRVNVINTTALPIYVKFYDLATVPTSANTPIITLMVPASGSITQSYVIPSLYLSGLSVRATTGVADNDTASPATPPIIEVETTN